MEVDVCIGGVWILWLLLGCMGLFGCIGLVVVLDYLWLVVWVELGDIIGWCMLVVGVLVVGYLFV